MKNYYPPATQRKAILFSILGVAVAAGLVVSAVLFILGGSISTEKRIEVVSVYSTQAEVATQTLKDIGLEVEIQRAVNIEIPNGLVYAQDPRPGAKVNLGDTVTIFVSQGGDRKAVPQVVGFEEADARRVLTSDEYGYEVEIQSVDSPAFPGVVVRQEPPQGEKRAPGETIQLFISEGTIRIPNLQNKLEDQAVSELEAIGATAIIIRQQHDEILEGFVINTRPGANLPLGDLKEVTVIVSSGPIPDA